MKNFQTILNKIKNNLWESSPKLPYIYRNLVFKGGGVRGIAYMGAVEELEKLGVIDGIERVAGTSAGAIAATLMSFRITLEETLVLFNNLDLSSIPQKSMRDHKGRILTLANPGSYKRLFESYGWYSSEYFYQWMSEVVAGKCDDNPRATFKDFKERDFRDLYIVVSNISRHRPEVFSYKTTPDVAVADAVRISMSIPLYFEALRFDGKNFGAGDYYVDGGLYKNYPLDIFESEFIVSDPNNFSDEVNWESLGLYLIADKDKNEDTAEYPKNLWEFVALTGKNYYDYHQLYGLKSNAMYKKRTIEINDCGVSSVDFDIQPGSDTYIALYESGRTAVQDYFKSL